MERAEANPLRILDSKRPDWQDMIEAAPQIGDHLTDQAAADFETVQQGLHALGIDFEIEPRLVRGLDYYTGTTFEFQSDALDGAQNAIGGGGRYDGLVEQMGGKPTPGIGFGIGIERVLIACDGEEVFGAPEPAIDVFVIDIVGGIAGVTLVSELRAAGLVRRSGVRKPVGEKTVGVADRAGARWGVMLGPRELAEGKVAVKDLASGEQQDVPRAEVGGLVANEKGRVRLMMRTHRAGDLRTEHVGTRWWCAAGSRTVETTAASCSSTSATLRGWCRS